MEVGRVPLDDVRWSSGLSDLRPANLWHFGSEGLKTVEPEDFWCKGPPVHNSLVLWDRSRAVFKL